jgi:hypothetical protein
MLERHFDKILYVTGAVTVTPLLQFFLPTLNLGLSGLVVGDDTGMLFARHWGLMAACFGALLIYAAARPAVRKPIVMAAMVEKLGLVALIAMAWNSPALAGLHVAAMFDGACVLLYGAYLYRARNA